MWKFISQARVFFQTMFDFFFFITSLFLLFYKNYYHFTKGKEPAQSPKSAVSFPLNPFLLGHGLRRCLKNLPTSKWVALATNKSAWQFFFNTPCHPELDSGSHFIFSKIIFDSFFFFISSLFLLFHKNYYHFTKGKEPAQSPKPAVLNLSYSQWLYLPVWLRLASPELASTQRCNACALLGVIRCFLGTA